MVRNRRNVALLFAVYFLQGLCFYSPVATLYRLEAGLTLFQTGLLESISLAAMLLLEIPWGRAADRIGHRRTLVICSALRKSEALIPATRRPAVCMAFQSPKMRWLSFSPTQAKR